jgi:hypothetical protein
MNRLEILQQLAAGAITPDEAERLLRGSSTSKPQPEPAPDPDPEPESATTPVSDAPKGGKPRWVNISVNASESNKHRAKVNLRIPYGVMSFLLNMGSRFSDDPTVREAIQALRSEGVGTVLSIEADSGEKVTIVLE